MVVVHRSNKSLLFAGALALLVFLVAYPRASPCASPEQGAISIQLGKKHLVPGDRLDVSYRTSPGTLQGPVDIYFSMAPPNGPLVFLQSDKKTFSESPSPFRRNVTIVEKTKTLLRFYPIKNPFGTYTCSVVLLHAGKRFGDADALASQPTSDTFTFAPLSQSQQSLIKERGNPDLLTVTWTAALKEKQELWFYYSGNPTQYSFVNGRLKSQSPLSGSAGGVPPQLDPSLLTPQTTLEQLTAVFGSPSSVEPFVDGSPDYQGVSFPVGLDVVFFKNRLLFGRTFIP
jgi:hypothetical protein